MRAVSLILFLMGCASTSFLSEDQVRRMTNVCEAQNQRALLWRNYEMRVVGITCDRHTK